jgi:hypothetical protein
MRTSVGGGLVRTRTSSSDMGAHLGQTSETAALRDRVESHAVSAAMPGGCGMVDGSEATRARRNVACRL